MRTHTSTTANAFFPIGTPSISQAPSATTGSKEPWVVCPGAGWRPWGYFTTRRQKADMPQA